MRYLWLPRYYLLPGGREYLEMRLVEDVGWTKRRTLGVLRFTVGDDGRVNLIGAEPRELTEVITRVAMHGTVSRSIDIVRWNFTTMKVSLNLPRPDAVARELREGIEVRA